MGLGLWIDMIYKLCITLLLNSREERSDEKLNTVDNEKSKSSG